MNVSISHPTDKANFTEVTIGDLTVWFSYRTPIGFLFPGHGLVVRENEWGPTTGKHINWVSTARRVPGADFERALDRITAVIGLDLTTVVSA